LVLEAEALQLRLSGGPAAPERLGAGFLAAQALFGSAFIVDLTI